MAMASTDITFVQVITATARDHLVLFGLTTTGRVYEYSAAREGWAPLSMVTLGPPDETIAGTTGTVG